MWLRLSLTSFHLIVTRAICPDDLLPSKILTSLLYTDLFLHVFPLQANMSRRSSSFENLDIAWRERENKFNVTLELSVTGSSNIKVFNCASTSGRLLPTKTWRRTINTFICLSVALKIVQFPSLSGGRLTRPNLDLVTVDEDSLGFAPGTKTFAAGFRDFLIFGIDFRTAVSPPSGRRSRAPGQRTRTLA